MKYGLPYKGSKNKLAPKIFELRPGEDYPAKVGYKFFDTIEEAKEYSISLGEEKDWIANAYNYILRRR